jgi:hypothetical protein
VELTFQHTDHDVGNEVLFVKQTVVLSGDMLAYCDSDVGSIQTETFTRLKAQEFVRLKYSILKYIAFVVKRDIRLGSICEFK